MCMHTHTHMQMLSENLQQVLVIEDDIDFEPNFRAGLWKLLDEAGQFSPNWDLM